MSPVHRVALLADTLTLRAPGGNHAPELARHLSARGHEVAICGAELPEGRMQGLARPEGASLADRVGRFAPDAILAYDALSPASWQGARLSRRLGVPLVLVEPGSTAEGGLSWRLLHRLGERLWGRTVRACTSALVAVDPLAREQALEEGFPARRISIVPEGVDLDLFRPGHTSRLVARHHIRGRFLLYTGPLDASRGVEILIRAFWRTVGQREDWCLVLAGDGGARRRLRQEVDLLGLGARVHWLPRPTEEELPGLMGACTLMAAPSLGHGVRGRQVARAMACGAPVIAADIPRLGFLVEPDVTGLLAAPGDEAAWTTALQRAASSPMARRRWGEMARRKAEERFDWRGVAAALESILAQACESQAA